MLLRELFFRIKTQLYHKNAIVITGMRQVGKSTLMRLLFNEFEGKKLWFDLDNPLDQLMFENIDYNAIYRELANSAQLNPGERLLVCIDEIQNLPEITKIIKYLIDHSVKFIVTGSSNYYLRNLFPESLSGRKFLYVLPVLTYREFLYFKGHLTSDQLTQNIDEAIKPKPKTTIIKTKELYGEYLEYGGFPEVVLTPDKETKHQVLKNIFASFFEKDIKVFTRIKKCKGIKGFALTPCTPKWEYSRSDKIGFGT
jgi:uncharacterized protein